MAAKTATTGWTKIGTDRSHTTGVTLVKVHPCMSKYAVLTPGAPIQTFGSFAAGWAFAKKTAAALEN